ncbi:hypothetical protein V501_04795 [Pseudogymnoascus sp. VKM F-4519 (FW-2642)]|nr:hypothetical protein V501_04795 [Pseudogymnoascus sp. VKM F-4519 (FW-2642)]
MLTSLIGVVQEIAITNKVTAALIIKQQIAYPAVKALWTAKTPTATSGPTRSLEGVHGSGEGVLTGQRGDSGALPRGAELFSRLSRRPAVRCAPDDGSDAELLLCYAVIPFNNPVRHILGRWNRGTERRFSGALRFGLTAKAILAERFYEHYLSGDLPGLRPSTNEDYQRYESFIDTGPLLRSVNLAHALDASNLMYDISSAFRAEWTYTGLTSSRVGKILSVASLIPEYEVGNFVLALFCLWAVLCAGLGLWYGFRRRPSDRLDGYTMLRKGADMAGELKENDEFMSGKPYHDARELRNVLFPIRDGAIFTGTFRDNDIMYDGMIQAFNSAITSAEEEQANA